MKLRLPRINDIKISGRLTRDPEIKYTNDNTLVVHICLAFDKLKKDEYGNYQAVSNFIDAVAFGKAAETLEKAHKGSPVIIEGNFFINTYTDKEGVSRKQPEININRIHILEKDDSESENDYPQTPKAEQSKQKPSYPTGDDDVPF